MPSPKFALHLSYGGCCPLFLKPILEFLISTDAWHWLELLQKYPHLRMHSNMKAKREMPKATSVLNRKSLC